MRAAVACTRARALGRASAHPRPRRARPGRVRAAAESSTRETARAAYKPADAIDLDGMRRELARRIDRSVKKVGKATTKLRVARERTEATLGAAEVTEAELLACPDVGACERELEELRRELMDLNILNDLLRSVKSTGAVTFVEEAYPLAKAWDVRDEPPERPPRVKKEKGPKTADKPRLPYWTFVSIDGIDIRVGRTSSDNDSVSCDPACRDSRDWWMHAAGCPGSHVVIRYTGDDLPRETMIDAAVLAAKNSKANQVGRAAVSLVRCRQVSKPRGAKPGLVQLSGDVKTVTVNVKDEAARLERLNATKQ